MSMFNKSDLQQAVEQVHRVVPPTLQFSWPQLSARVGADVWIKHENHNPTGAFKVRGGVTFIEWLKRTHPDIRGVVSATRGNHGQSQARAASAAGLAATIVVPVGNSPEKNLAMQSFGATLVEFGQDFDSAREEAGRIARDQGLYPIPSFHLELVRGVATYGYELFTSVPSLQRVYVPIGAGSGICGLIAVRDALGLSTDIVGVVSDRADSALRSVRQGQLIETESAKTFADGMAVRVPSPEALEIYSAGAAEIVSVSDDEIAEAIRILYRDTHNVAEGAGAAAMAAIIKQADKLAGKRVGAILTGGNIDTDKLVSVLTGVTPAP